MLAPSRTAGRVRGYRESNALSALPRSRAGTTISFRSTPPLPPLVPRGERESEPRGEGGVMIVITNSDLPGLGERQG